MHKFSNDNSENSVIFSQLIYNLSWKGYMFQYPGKIALKFELNKKFV